MWYSLKSLATVSEPLDKQHETILRLFFPYAFLNENFIITWVDPKEVKLIYLVFFIKMSLK